MKDFKAQKQSRPSFCRQLPMQTATDQMNLPSKVNEQKSTNHLQFPQAEKQLYHKKIEVSLAKSKITC
jgi:hypothetical protein